MRKIIKVFSLLVISLSLTNNGIAADICEPKTDPSFKEVNTRYAYIKEPYRNSSVSYYYCGIDNGGCAEGTIVMTYQGPKKCANSKWESEITAIQDGNNASLSDIIKHGGYSMKQISNTIYIYYNEVCNNSTNCVFYKFDKQKYQSELKKIEENCTTSGGEVTGSDLWISCKCSKNKNVLTCYTQSEQPVTATSNTNATNNVDKGNNSTNTKTENTETNEESTEGTEENTTNNDQNSAQVPTATSSPNVTPPQKNNEGNTLTNTETEDTETNEESTDETEDTNTDEESTNEESTEETEESTTDDDKNIEGKEKLYNALSGASTAMVGIGAMQAAQALSEKKSDAAAETDMTAYLATMRCDYGRGNTYKLGEEEIDVGGGNELINYVTEYKTLASRLQKTKTALKMTPGIESEKILDKSESNLYTYAPPQKVQSTFGSLANALRDENSEDAQKWAEQKDKTQKRLIVGASVAAAGLVTAVTTNLTLGKKLRDAKRAEQDNNGIGDAKIFDNND